jgi:hypothetical protein
MELENTENLSKNNSNSSKNSNEENKKQTDQNNDISYHENEEIESDSIKKK